MCDLILARMTYGYLTIFADPKLWETFSHSGSNCMHCMLSFHGDVETRLSKETKKPDLGGVSLDREIQSSSDAQQVKKCL